MNEITAIELWKRWFDWQGTPWVTTGDSKYCFFCKSSYPIHDEPMCVYVSAKELVRLDNKGVIK